MQTRHRISLNAVRVFATIARTGSLTAAGADLGVTAGAVSHQLKKLEDELGVSFFRRGNNSVSLTDAGQRFYQEVAPAIALIERSADALQRDENEISVFASMSFALRWLIPSLDRFRALCPDARVRVETSAYQTFPAIPAADVRIRYVRAGEQIEGWQPLCRDVSRPVVSPAVLARHGHGRELALSKIPALRCAAGNWDWKLWCETRGVSIADLTLVHEFDTDDAALHACVAGLGMVLAPPLLTARETQSGALVAIPGYPPVEIGSYRYQRRSETRMVRQFCAWMSAEMQAFE